MDTRQQAHALLSHRFERAAGSSKGCCLPASGAQPLAVLQLECLLLYAMITQLPPYRGLECAAATLLTTCYADVLLRGYKL